MVMWGTSFEEYNTFFLMLPELPGEDFWDEENYRMWAGRDGSIERFANNFPDVSSDGVRREWLQLRLRSGLYYNTNPPVNIYYVDRFYNEEVLFFTRDGRNFVYLQDFSGTFLRAEEAFDMDVLRFFADGVQVASYIMSDLVEDRNSIVNADQFFTDLMPWMGESIEHSQQRGALVHDQQLGTLSLETIEGRRFTFDITTGEIIGDESTNINFNPQTGA